MGGGFSQGDNYPVGGWPGDLIAADLHGDGCQALAVANHGDLTVSVLYPLFPSLKEIPN